MTWTDAWFDTDENRPAEWKAEQVIETVGFLLRERPVVTIAHERVEPGVFRGTTHVPRGMVRKVERL